MRLFKRKPQTENRESGPYTDAIVRALIESAASASTDQQRAGDPLASSVVETACQLYGSSFAAATIKGDRAQAFGPAERADLARQLIRNGEAVYLIEVTSNGVEFIRASSWDVTGSYRPETWRYRVDLPGPSATSTQRHVGGDEVLHFRYASSPSQPWLGISPIDSAKQSAALLATLEQCLVDESGGVRGYLISISHGVTDDQVAGIKKDLAQLHGDTTLVSPARPTQGQTITKEWEPQRVGPNWPDSINKAFDAAKNQLMLALGVPLDLIDSNEASASREAWRRFLFGSLTPLALKVAEELTVKLDQEVSFSFDNLQASDIQGRARAFQSLTSHGDNASSMPLDDARKLTGLETDE